MKQAAAGTEGKKTGECIEDEDWDTVQGTDELNIQSDKTKSSYIAA